MSAKYTYDEVEKAILTLGVSDKTKDRALLRFSREMLNEKSITPAQAANNAIDEAAAHITKDKDRRVKFAKETLGLTSGARVEEAKTRVIDTTKTLVDKGKDFAANVKEHIPHRKTKPETADSTDKKSSKTKPKQVYRHVSYRPWFYALCVLIGALIGFIVWSVFGPIAGNLAADNFDSPTYGMIIMIILAVLLIGGGYLLGRWFARRRRKKDGYEEALKDKEFRHWSHNVLGTWFVIVLPVAFLVSGAWLWWYSTENYVDIRNREGVGNATGVLIGYWFWIMLGLTVILWLIMALTRKATGYVKFTKDKRLSKEEEEITLPETHAVAAARTTPSSHPEPA